MADNIATNNEMARKMKMPAGGRATWSDAPAMPQEGGDSRAQGTAVGSGSRPTPSMVKIATSAPEDAHTQGRGVPGALK